jgi:hypothetical protein
VDDTRPAIDPTNVTDQRRVQLALERSSNLPHHQRGDGERSRSSAFPISRSAASITTRPSSNYLLE